MGAREDSVLLLGRAFPRVLVVIPLILVPCASLHDPFRFLAPLGLVPYAYRHDLSQFWFLFLRLLGVIIFLVVGCMGR